MSVLELQQVKEVVTQAGVTRQQIESALGVFAEQKVLLVGDLIVDVYTECTAIGKTAKTPTLSVKKGKSEIFGGGACLIANTLLALGAEVTFVSIAGDDWGYEYIAGLKHPRLKTCLLKDKNRPTTVKERFWVDGYKLLQLDTVENHDIPEPLEIEIASILDSHAPNHNLLMVADNRHGIMTPTLIQRMRDLQQRTAKPMVVDTQVSNRWGNLELYTGVGMICVNEHEARFYLRDERSPVEEIMHKMVASLNPSRLLVKLKNKGMVGWDRTAGLFNFPAFPVKSIDPIGAGDSFLSAAALTYAETIAPTTSMYLANAAGAIAVTKMGTAATTYEELETFVKTTLDQIGL